MFANLSLVKGSGVVFLVSLRREKCGVSLPMPCTRPSLSRGHQTVTIMNHEGQIYSTVFKCLPIVPNAKGASRYPPLMENFPTCSHMQ